MNRWLVALLSVCIFFNTAKTPAQDGKLERLREEVNKGPTDSHPSKSRDDCTYDDEDMGGSLIWFVAAIPFTGPHRLLDDNFHNDCAFLKYPYADHRPGSMLIVPQCQPLSEVFPDGASPRLQPWSFQLALEDSNDFSGLNRANGRLLVDTCTRFGLQTSWSYLNEQLCGCHDSLLLGEMNLVFRFAQSERMQMRTGLGARVLADAHDSTWGFNFLYGADLFPVKPVVLSGELEAGSLGSAGVFHARATMGLLYKRYEIYAGYDFLLIGSVGLQGPVLGFRLWF